MKISQVAIQLYTLRDFCNTATDLAETARRVREIGFESVQLSGISGSITAAEIVSIMQDNGLRICATHEDPDLIRHQPLKAIENLKALGVEHTAYPYPQGVNFSDPANMKAMVTDLDAAGAIFRENGCTLSYHHHGNEFIRIGDETLMDYIFRATAPENLKFELDTYWVQYGGGDPVQWCAKTKDRLPLIHLKDYGFGIEKPFFAEVGYGNLDFKRIIPQAEASGCQWFIVEQDTCPGDPFDSIKKSFIYLRDEIAAG